MGRRFELDRELNHISPAWMSWLCAEAQTVGYQIRTQGLSFHSPFLLFSPSLFSFLSHSLPLSVSLCFFLSLQLSSYPSFFSPPPSPLLFSLTGWPGCLISGTSAVGCSDNRENVPFLFFLLLHLSKSPLHLSIRVWDCKSLPDRAGWRFGCRWQGSYVVLKN